MKNEKSGNLITKIFNNYMKTRNFTIIHRWKWLTIVKLYDYLTARKKCKYKNNFDEKMFHNVNHIHDWYLSNAVKQNKRKTNFATKKIKFFSEMNLWKNNFCQFTTSNFMITQNECNGWWTNKIELKVLTRCMWHMWANIFKITILTIDFVVTGEIAHTVPTKYTKCLRSWRLNIPL